MRKGARERQMPDFYGSPGPRIGSQGHSGRDVLAIPSEPKLLHKVCGKAVHTHDEDPILL